MTIAEKAAQARGVQRLNGGVAWDGLFRGLTQAAALTVVLAVAGIFALLLVDSLPALRQFGPKFVVTAAWNPVTENFGALPAIYGTLATSLIGMLIGVPLAFGAAFFINELCPHALRAPITLGIELLAAVPSIIYGMWGLFILAPLLSAHVQPLLTAAFGPLPVVGALFRGAPYGIGILTAGLILGIMVLPYIAAVARQVIGDVPPLLREAAYALGASRWEVFRHVLLPYARRGLLGGVMLGLGRALGETMAVTFVVGNAHRIVASLLAPGTTISATLANEFTEAVGDVYLSSLLYLGLILFVITFSVLAAARLLLGRAPREERP